jgi:hypothetical protein
VPSTSKVSHCSHMHYKVTHQTDVVYHLSITYSLNGSVESGGKHFRAFITGT